jgi:hypothetical protein
MNIAEMKAELDRMNERDNIIRTGYVSEALRHFPKWTRKDRRKLAKQIKIAERNAKRGAK